MNIDVNGFGRKGDEEEERGEASATDQGMIDFIDRMINNRSGGGASVYKNKLIGTILASRLG